MPAVTFCQRSVRLDLDSREPRKISDHVISFGPTFLSSPPSFACPSPLFCVVSLGDEGRRLLATGSRPRAFQRRRRASLSSWIHSGSSCPAEFAFGERRENHEGEAVEGGLRWNKRRELYSIVSCSRAVRMRCVRRSCLRCVEMSAWLNANDVTTVSSRIGGMLEGANHRGRGLDDVLLDISTANSLLYVRDTRIGEERGWGEAAVKGQKLRRSKRAWNPNSDFRPRGVSVRVR